MYMYDSFVYNVYVYVYDEYAYVVYVYVLDVHVFAFDLFEYELCMCMNKIRMCMFPG